MAEIIDITARPRRRQDWRRCGMCSHQQAAHRWGIYIGSCASCRCSGWRPTTAYTVSLTIARRILRKHYR